MKNLVSSRLNQEKKFKGYSYMTALKHSLSISEDSFVMCLGTSVLLTGGHQRGPTAVFNIQDTACSQHPINDASHADTMYSHLQLASNWC